MSSCFGSIYWKNPDPKKCAKIKEEMKKAELEVQKAKEAQKEQELQR